MERGPWMQTFTGRAFYVLDPRPEDIELEDIAHGLAFECRYNGQCHEFWSVAQHSICVAREARRLAAGHATRGDRLFLLALLHDADEAYVKDIPRPLKVALPGYREIAEKVRHAINVRFQLLPMLEACRDLLPIIKRADLAVLRSERDALMAPPPQPWDIDEALVEPAQVRIEPRYPAAVFNTFFGVLIGAMGKAKDEANAYGMAQELRG
jgi:5'-deoxynucleotidase YfbR-like HD superfamily hydrolase